MLEQSFSPRFRLNKPRHEQLVSVQRVHVVRYGSVRGYGPEWLRESLHVPQKRVFGPNFSCPATFHLLSDLLWKNRPEARMTESYHPVVFPIGQASTQAVQSMKLFGVGLLISFFSNSLV